MLVRVYLRESGQPDSVSSLPYKGTKIDSTLPDTLGINIYKLLI